MERKRFAFAVKEVKADAGTFEGHASVFNIPDDGDPPDIMLPGAFAKSLQEWGPQAANRIKILALHHYDWLPIGKPTLLQEDAKGLLFNGQISDTMVGKDVMTLMRDGVITEMSIGYDPIKWAFDEKLGIRFLQEVRLYEISPVTWAMHPDALITSVKGGCPFCGGAMKRQHERHEAEPAAATPPGGLASDPAVGQSLKAMLEVFRSLTIEA
jgi:hypothetical protein